MNAVSYAEVVRMAEQLTPDEQKALFEYLKRVVHQRELSQEEWEALFDSLKIDQPVNSTYSMRREDWYGDDGR